MKLRSKEFIRRTKKRYDEIAHIWGDKWHSITHRRIGQSISDFLSSAELDLEKCSILNAGSGGNTYDICSRRHTHVDLSYRHLMGADNAIVGNIENLPFKDASFDLIICVGSTINYCDSIAVVQEFERVLRSNGLLILEFERSASFEYIATGNFADAITLSETEYLNSKEVLWTYSESFMESIVKIYGMKILRKRRFHIISPIIYRLTKSSSLSSNFAYLDRLLSFAPFHLFSSNAVFLCKKC